MISYSLGPADGTSWTNLYAHNDTSRVLVAVLKPTGDGTRLEGVTLPGVDPASFVNVQSGDPTGMGPNHLQIIT